ncbi:hypothetical protein LOC68_19735 [Blastopirellula sp. JC732]|uniref:Uncharacterized protein n=1 Tax=Blastopirellula sediminis TaxID=2894196 RepID=A0A9X1MQK4_9BACT|nr:hypothetical protein [Blastopirellula sediminis]MCC9606069.1 hypothetical protein [Blastopirellula sediminis]MCC9630632.1 hypothetical protein [Blastopirellula sediminis]
MSYTWKYPLYLVAHAGGYASIVDPQDESRQLLVALTSEEKALDFMQQFGILGAPRQLNNDREFAWLLESLRAPVTMVCFDPDPLENDVNAAWTATVETLLNDRLEVDYSPWNYPVFLLRQETGFSSIVGLDVEGNEVVVLCLFSNSQLADEYLIKTGDAGVIETLETMAQTREIMEMLREDIAAVAVDPEVRESERVASHCISVETLLNKYLIRA